ncbi:MAG: UDP-N-acetylmuramate--L-alanine ligase [Erysipelotrichia bacterium]|nr:UDP-N-acetylmuramate--L-alanine ligase [Erysipelotrichia bacterium]
MNAFFVGIGGMGMSGLAKILHSAGFCVAGSDRNLDGDYCRRLRDLGVKIYPQDGAGPELFMQQSGLGAKDFCVVKSTAVENQVPDVQTAERLGIAQIMRSDLLAMMFNEKKGIAIGGTAGKTTTTGLVAWILQHAGKQPSCAVGGIIAGLDTNAFRGKGPHFVIEADESDGSIVKYRPWISVVTNISRDHKTLDELNGLFTDFLNNTAADGLRLVCAEDQNAANLQKVCSAGVKTYGITEKADYQAEAVHMNADSAVFKVNNIEFTVRMPGEHNVLNALAAIAVTNMCGLELEEIADSLRAFPGMKRRFEKIGTASGITVVDDFAHNPAEIAAAVRAARKASKRRFIVYQPHGFGPTSFTRDDLIEVFSALKDDEFLFLDDIFYGGGTVNRDVTSEEIVKAVRQRFKNAWYTGSREEIIARITCEAQSGDMVLVMGARDINIICQQILERLSRECKCAA